MLWVEEDRCVFMINHGKNKKDFNNKLYSVKSKTWQIAFESLCNFISMSLSADELSSFRLSEVSKAFEKESKEQKLFTPDFFCTPKRNEITTVLDKTRADLMYEESANGFYNVSTKINRTTLEIPKLTTKDDVLKVMAADLEHDTMKKIRMVLIELLSERRVLDLSYLGPFMTIQNFNVSQTSARCKNNHQLSVTFIKSGPERSISLTDDINFHTLTSSVNMLASICLIYPAENINKNKLRIYGNCKLCKSPQRIVFASWNDKDVSEAFFQDKIHSYIYSRDAIGQSFVLSGRYFEETHWVTEADMSKQRQIMMCVGL
jgi:hypothetical protein